MQPHIFLKSEYRAVIQNIYERLIVAIIVCYILPCGMSGRMCLKSPPWSIGFPPKSFVAASGSATKSTSHRVLSRASNAKIMVQRLILHILSWWSSIGILKHECDVLSLSKSIAVIPDDANGSTIFPSDLNL